MAKSNKKKITTAIVAGTTALALVLGGTFAWQSINQTALNEASDVINPGGRLHDDFNGSDKNVYVENFTDPANGGENIFARVRLDEYFEIVLNKGAGEGIEKTEVITAGAEKDNVDTYITHIFGGDNATDAYWSWTTGGQATYMPTFNKDKDSLDADINGTYEGTTIGDDVHYDDYEEIPSEKTADAVYDADADNLPDGDKAYVEETHYAADTLNATLISMDEWEDLGSPVGEYWVYDTDGWVYWAAPIAPGTATGLLLDEIALNDTMDDSWYYAINVVAQFITADDLGKTDGTGFYDTENGTVPSDRALALLEAIGVDMNSEDNGVVPDEPESPLQLTVSAEPNWYVPESSMEATVSLTASATYDGADIADLSAVTWSISGNTEEGTALGTETGDSVTLTIAPFEEGNIIVSAGFTYVDDEQGINETVTEDVVVTNGPSVATMWVFDNDEPEPDGFYADSAYIPGTAKTFNLTTYFFPVYTGTIQPIEDAYSGEAAELLEQKYTCTLVKEYDGVTFTQDGANMTVIIDETATETIEINCELDNGFIMTYSIEAIEPGDTTAPSVSIETSSTFLQDITIFNISDGDFPLTVKMYGLDSEEANYDNEPLQTITITKTDDGVEYEASEAIVPYANLQNVTMVDGNVMISYNHAPDRSCYLHCVVSDTSGNESSANLFVQAAVGCFVAGTQVQTVNGLVNIEDIQVGDQVYSVDLATGETVISSVAWVQETRYTDATYTIYAGGEEIVTTYEHPFYVIGKEWVAAEDLAVGDVIKTMTGEVTITDIVYTELETPVQVYNFMVDGTHNYLITESGILVHNVQK